MMSPSYSVGHCQVRGRGYATRALGKAHSNLTTPGTYATGKSGLCAYALDALWVRSAVEPSEKWPVAVNCCVAPTVIVGLIGLISMLVTGWELLLSPHANNTVLRRIDAAKCTYLRLHMAKARSEKM